MSNTDEEIEKLAFNNYFIKTGEIVAESSRPDLVIGFIAGYKAALQQNKVSDVTAEEILHDKMKDFCEKNNEYSEAYMTPEQMREDPIFIPIISAMKEFAISESYDALDEYKRIESSIVNERKDNIPEDFKKVTGHDSPKEMIAYEKGREDEQKVIMDWIEKWEGGRNSGMGALLNKKFNERKDNVEIIRLQNIGIAMANDIEQKRKEIESLKEQLAIASEQIPKGAFEFSHFIK